MNEKYDERKVYAAEIVEELVEMRFQKLQSMYIDDHSSSIGRTAFDVLDDSVVKIEPYHQ